MPKDAKKSIKIDTLTSTTVIDQDGTVLQENSVISYKIPKEDDYVKMYVKSLLYMADLPKTLNPILAKLLEFMPYANGRPEFAINRGIKQIIAEELGIKGKNPDQKVSNAITDLVKGQILLRTGRGLYMFNPHLFGKGEWKDIAKLRLEVDFTPEGKTVKGVIERANKAEKESNKQCEGQLSVDELSA